MKNNLLKASLLTFGFLALVSACNQSKNAKNQKETVENNFKLKIPADTIAFETKYNDGRITGVRNLKYYNYLVKNNKPFGDEKLGLTTVFSEWNKYDANVACPQGGFIQVPMSLQEPEKSEMKKNGIDANSAMVGGDEETNRRFKQPSIRYWEVASKMFQKEFKNLKKAETISNRDTTYVTFDFITNKGFYTVQVLKSELESGKSIWSNMFKESKFLNTEMARVQNESAIDDQKRYEASQLKKNKKNRIAPKA